MEAPCSLTMNICCLLYTSLLNALEPGTYLPPHRHTGKEDTYLVLRGSLLAFFYDDAGNVTDKVCRNPSEGKYGLEIPSNTWHSIIALESGTVIFDIKKGPNDDFNLPRLSLQAFFNPSLEQLEWYGRGPIENYRDRKMCIRDRTRNAGKQLRLP